MRLLVAFVLVVIGCARAPQTAVVPREPRTVSVLHAGDAIEIDAWNDASIAGTYVLDSKGGIDIAMCGRVELGGVAEADATDVVRRCLVAADAYSDPIYVNVRVVAKKDPPPRADVPDPNAPPVPEGSTCGELLLEEAELVGQGKGAAHPEVIATARAREFRCSEEPRRESLGAACDAVKQRQAELSSDYGPAHPTMVGIAAALGVCSKELDERR